MLREDKANTRARSPIRVAWLVLPVWVVLAVEMVGNYRFGKNMYRGQYAIDLRGHYWTLISATVGAVIVSPLLVVTAFVVARLNRNDYPKHPYQAVLLFLTLSLLVSMFSCAWSCGGHPTWTSGYR